jgi:hypothetical protein
MKGMEELQIEGLYVPVLAPSSALHTCMALDFDSTVPGLNSEQSRHCAELASRALRKHPAPLSFSDLHRDRAAIKRETIDRLSFVESGCEGRDLNGPKMPNPNCANGAGCISPLTGLHLGNNGVPLNVSNFRHSSCGTGRRFDDRNASDHATQRFASAGTKGQGQETHGQENLPTKSPICGSAIEWTNRGRTGLPYWRELGSRA